jgi:hypothetical protein
LTNVIINPSVDNKEVQRKTDFVFSVTLPPLDGGDELNYYL